VTIAQHCYSLPPDLVAATTAFVDVSRRYRRFRPYFRSSTPVTCPCRQMVAVSGAFQESAMQRMRQDDRHQAAFAKATFAVPETNS
jgi:hypothetical protein